MPGNGNGGGNGSQFTTQWVGGEGGRQQPFRPPEPEAPPPPPPPGPGDPGYVREARNVQRANIDRTSFYDPTEATMEMGREYLTQRSATHPQPAGSTGAGAVGYEMPDADFDERIY